VPCKKTDTSRSSRPTSLLRWLRNMINQRNRAWQRFRRGDADAKGVYSRLRSRCKAALQSFLVQSERKVLTSKNRKLFYSFLNKRLKTSTGIYWASDDLTVLWPLALPTSQTY
jgi:hypothetical protein